MSKGLSGKKALYFRGNSKNLWSVFLKNLFDSFRIGVFRSGVGAGLLRTRRVSNVRLTVGFLNDELPNDVPERLEWRKIALKATTFVNTNSIRQGSPGGLAKQRRFSEARSASQNSHRCRQPITPVVCRLSVDQQILRQQGIESPFFMVSRNESAYKSSILVSAGRGALLDCKFKELCDRFPELQCRTGPLAGIF